MVNENTYGIVESCLNLTWLKLDGLTTLVLHIIGERNGLTLLPLPNGPSGLNENFTLICILQHVS